MAEQTTSSIAVSASPEAVMSVIADFSAYPSWAQGVKRADPVEGTGRDPGGRPEEVYFELDASPIQDAYTLHYDWHGDDSVSWTLVEGRMLRAMDGAYELERRGADTEVTYRLAVDIAIPMIGMLKRKAEKVIIDTALKGLKKRVESLS
jgi:hypothetical protein